MNQDKVNCFIKNIVAVTVIILILVGLYYFVNPRDYVTKLISDMVDKRIETVMSNYKQVDEQQKKEIISLQKQIKDTETKLAKISKKIKGLEGDINENKPPKTVEEIRSRFRELGFPVIN